MKTEMGAHESFVQWLKIFLLAAFLVAATWNLIDRPAVTHAQLAAASGFNYTHITTATNTLVKSSNGTFHNLTINTASAGAITIVDTSNGACTGGTTIAVFAASAPIGNYVYDLQFSNGLCITTGATGDMTATTR